jgi:amphi-Trp domain-containing protein
MDKKKISMGKVMQLAEVIPYLQEFVNALKNGQVKVSKGGEELILTPVGDLFLTIEAKVKKHTERFTFEISWSKKESDENREEELLAIMNGSSAGNEETPLQSQNKNVAGKNKETRTPLLQASGEEVKK